jgi:hypothetical protein
LNLIDILIPNLIPNIANAFAALETLHPTERRHCSRSEAMRQAQSMSGDGGPAGLEVTGR